MAGRIDMTFLVKLALYGWIPVVIALFTILPPRRAVIAAFLIAWLFLPMAGIRIGGLPDYTKMSATCVGVLLGAALFDPERILSFRFHWVDLPVAAFCLSPFVTAILNGLGAYEGASAIVEQVVAWGLPYLIGRVYFTDLEGIRELAIGMFIGGLIYVPLCWIEFAISPQLHRLVYGYHQHRFNQTIRLGGYRPMVFMQHGLMVGMWMGMTALIGVWLWRSRTMRHILGFPVGLPALGLLITAVLCRSLYAIALLFAGLTVLAGSRTLRISVLAWGLVLASPTLLFLRASGLFSGESVVSLVNQYMGPERASSVALRFNNENQLSVKAAERPIFGWGRFGRARIISEKGRDASVTDSLWIITLGNAGLVGLAALTSMLLLPLVLVLTTWRAELWSHPALAAPVALGVVCALYMLDHSMNAMVNPIFMLAAGGVNAVHCWVMRQRRAARGDLWLPSAAPAYAPAPLVAR